MIIPFEKFAQVPWYRRSDTISALILIGFCLFPPLLLAACVVCLTGDVFINRIRKDGTLARWSRFNKVAALLIMPIQILGLSTWFDSSNRDLVKAIGFSAWLLTVIAFVIRLIVLRVKPASASLTSNSSRAEVSSQASTQEPLSHQITSSSYWIVTQGVSKGPYSAEALKRMFNDGFVTANTLVRRDDSQENSVEQIIHSLSNHSSAVTTEPRSQLLPTRTHPQSSSISDKLIGYGMLFGFCVVGILLVSWFIRNSLVSSSTPTSTVPSTGNTAPVVNRLPVDLMRFVSSKADGRVYYAEGLRDDAVRLDLLLWQSGFFSTEKSNLPVWLGQDGDRKVFGIASNESASTPDQLLGYRCFACQMAAQLYPGRPFEWVNCDREWRINDRITLQEAHEIIASPKEHIYVEMDREFGEKVAAQLRSSGIFNGQRTSELTLHRGPNQWILCCLTNIEFDIAEARKELSLFCALMQQKMPKSEEFVIRIIPVSNKPSLEIKAPSGAKSKTP